MDHVSGHSVAYVQRVFDPGLGESLRSQQAGVATSAGLAVFLRVVTTARVRVIDAEPLALLDDLGLGEVDQRGMNLELLGPLNARLGGEVSHSLVGCDVLGSAVGITGVVQCVDPHKDV